MAQTAKTTSASFDREEWLAGVDAARRDDAQTLLDLFGRVTGWPPRLWGPTIVGFGRYEYRYDTGRSGEAAATGFAMRKAEIVVYVTTGYEGHEALLDRLGPHRTGKSCLYLKRLGTVDAAALEELIRAGLRDLEQRFPVHPL